MKVRVQRAGGAPALLLAALLLPALSACEDGSRPDEEKPAVRSSSVWQKASGPFGSSAVLTICYGGPDEARKFVAAGEDGKMAYSLDGKKWTAISQLSAFSASAIRALCYGGAAGKRKFVAAADNGKIAYSADGSSWTVAADSTFAGAYINGLGYGNGMFVAVGKGIATSLDGITWKKADGRASGYRIAYGSGVFVKSDLFGPTAYSANAVDWAEPDSGASAGTGILALTYGGSGGRELFIAGCKKGKLLYSTNGIAWEAVKDSPFNNYVYGTAYGADTFIALGLGADSAAASADGIQWTTLPGNTAGLCVSYGNGVFVSGGLEGKLFYYIPK